MHLTWSTRNHGVWCNSSITKLKAVIMTNWFVQKQILLSSNQTIFSSMFRFPLSGETANSFSSSWHSKWQLCQENGSTRGWVGSCSLHGSWICCSSLSMCHRPYIDKVKLTRALRSFSVHSVWKCHQNQPDLWLSSALLPRQHSIGYMGDGFYRSKDPTNSIKVLKEKATKEKTRKRKQQHIYIHNNTH